MKLIIDSFAGGGGASTGIEMALGRSPDVAINHDPVALAMHEANHPETLHLANDIWGIDPMTVRPGEPVGLMWFSPDCKHFSKAKGGKPRDRNIRDLAWVVVDWAEKRKPDVILLENVEEFRTWGPLDNDGQPIAELAGQTFEDWVKRLRKAGYRVQWNELRACDFGAPTIRKRFFMVARRDGKPIVWPKPTHGDTKSDAVRKGRLKPWRTAAEIIDWSLPCPSVFDDAATIWQKHALRAVRPLAPNTGARIARGIRRYVIDAVEPFIVNLTHGGREEPGAEPFRTVTGANRGEKAVVAPSLAVFRGASSGAAADAPLPTVTANSFKKRPGGAPPLGVVAPVLTYAQQGGSNRDPQAPLHTVTASAKDQNAVIAPHLMTMRNAGKSFTAGNEPAHTITAGGAHMNVVAASLVQTGYGEREGQAPRALDPNAPLGTVVAGGAKHAAITAFLAQQNGGPRNDAIAGRAASEPVSTVTASGSQQNVIAAHMLTMKGSDRRDAPAGEPARTVMAGGGQSALVAGALVKYYGTGDPQELDGPLHTVTVKDRFGLAELALAAPPFTTAHEARAREVADFLRAHGAWDEREFVTVEIAGLAFVIADIGMRMLTPRELFNAQGFPPDYRIDEDLHGNRFSKSDQIGRAGNSVCPPLAAALAGANCAELAMHAEAAE